MIVCFEKTYLRDLYVYGKCSDKKHRYRRDIIKRYKRGVDYLKWVERKEDLFRINSLHFESLKGDKAGLFSIRAGDQYRIEFTLTKTEGQEDKPILTICNIVELSNHYD